MQKLLLFPAVIMHDYTLDILFKETQEVPPPPKFANIVPALVSTLLC